MTRRAPALAAALAALALAAGACAQDEARALLARLSLEQKAGQLLMAWTLTKADGQAEAHAALAELVERAGLGGVILSTGDAGEAVPLVRALQARAAVPLLVAADFEAGVAFRLRGATPLGCNMLVGATCVPELARAMGRVTAREGSALGFHLAFAPVVDVNVNPRNPIINLRSFGEDPTEVARFSAAFVRGMEAAGMLATAKHFPGHGDVASDSHLHLPLVPGDRARLERVELLPFRAAIDAGVSAIMTGHLAVPGLGEDPAVPATLSHRILTEELRERMGFRGLVVTDALDMGGVRSELDASEVAVRALLAGADLLLMPPDALRTRDALALAVRTGRVPIERLDASVLRILRAKERADLLRGGGLPDPEWRDVVGAQEHEELAARIAARGVTLVRDRGGLVPLAAASHPLLLTLQDFAGDETRAFRDALEELGCAVDAHRLGPDAPEAEAERALAALAEAELVIADLHCAVATSVEELALPPLLARAMTALATRPRVILVAFGNPYAASLIPDVATYVCAYSGGPYTARAAAAVVLGRAPALGRLPISIPGVAARGAGITPAPEHESTRER
jgi:beta-glucosidase-like glycosyl hydrolase